MQQRLTHLSFQILARSTVAKLSTESGERISHGNDRRYAPLRITALDL